MPIIKLTDIHKSFDRNPLFYGLKAQFYPGEKVGLVGPNGCGKTTLFKMILSEVDPDVGEVSVRKGLKIGYLPQEPIFCGDNTVLQEMHAGLADLFKTQKKIETLASRLGELSGDELEEAMAEYDRLSHLFERNGGYTYEARIRSILHGVGLEEPLYNAKTSTLSGGQLSRLGLAKVLLSETDMLLLDEPTNHLDLQATVWLEKYLRSYNGGAIIISHDRYLLDKVTEKIAEVDQGKCTIWRGNYSQFVENRRLERDQQQKQYESRVKMIEQTRDFIARNKNQEGMRGTARGRAKRLERMLDSDPDFLSKPTEKKTMKLSFADATSQSSLVLRCEGVCKSFGDICLFKHMTFDLLAGDRLGVTGPNGTGKSTFLKLALGREKSTDGRIRMGKFLTVGYLDQQGQELNQNTNVLDEARSAKPELSTEVVRGKLGAFLFTGDDVFKQVSELSGGQQNRLMLFKVMLAEPDVLVLDEPTNHLDIDSKEVLENALRDYNGTIIVVSHDRYFIDRVVDKLLVIGANDLGEKELGNYELVEGEGPLYSKYAEQVEKRQAEALAKARAKDDSGSKKARRSGSATSKPKPKTPPELRKFNKYSVEELEDFILEMEENIEKLQEKFGNEDLYKDPSAVTDLHAEVDKHKEELDILYKAYEFRTG
ncbi:putative ABC transporter ATP-binding protein YjjK [Anaerohalosphaera lusitana]|uniref:Putative ABC transporter ATP-binding protein YjjK n=1 Tax=Anaerohalosphaera lusitana TaxID=1936003 RepID=A0A1U9NI82_9BACT|nr:ABC-F family ATP-binding cassette domain-containing protein [Anaerohalosphaera lusitana]AQT67310.1 putative ABC transporter ATP-binding protein YjjK [Anaerohalosphaera lusitana]